MFRPRMSSSTSNSEPLSLLLRAVVGAALVAIILVLAYHNGYHAARVDYHGGVTAKEERLTRLPSPKVVVIGGSNATFGLDSEVLERALCKPVVNMSIHATLGMEFMVNQVKEHLGMGDIVITSFELSSYSEPIKDNEVHVLTVDRAPSALHSIPWFRRPRVVLNVAILRLQSAWKHATGEWGMEVTEAVYTTKGFNGRGDMIAHLGLPQRGPDRQQPVEHRFPIFNATAAPVLKDLVENARRSGAQVVFTWPAIAASGHRADIDSTLAAEMRAAGFELLGDPTTYVFPDTAFHDTHYHLRATGRQLRTRQLIRDLCESGQIACCYRE